VDAQVAQVSHKEVYMVTTLKPQQARPWHHYRKEKQWRLLEPGFAGFVHDDEMAYIQGKLKVDASLSFAWGFRPGQKTRSESAIRRVAMHGDPDCRATNIKLARSRSEPPQISHDKVA
jgi:hypothetical protein